MSEQFINTTPMEVTKVARRIYRHKWPYYNPVYAEGARKLLDRLHSIGETLRVPAQGVSIETLRIQYYQGVYFLVDEDPKGAYYQELYSRTRCKIHREDKFLELSVRKTLADMPVNAVRDSWRNEMLEFMEVAVPGSRFPNLELSFTEADKAWIRSQLEPFGAEFVWQLTDSQLILIKDKV